MQENASYRPASPERAPQEAINTPFFGPEPEDEGNGIGEYIAALFQYKWLILLVTLLGFGVGYAEYFRSVPQYQASALIQVERRGSGYTGAILGSLSQYQPVFADYLNLPAEVVLMKSREAMRSVMQELDLDLLAEGFPLQPKDIVYVDTADLVRWNRFINLLLPTRREFGVDDPIVE
jgi:uncharacterized protein involved in exopolysaccharide biosynthesis